MKVTLDNGGTVDLGITEVSPTVGITDYSRRVTDDFGVTTVVRRGFARRMSLRFALDYTAVDAVQAQLADLRATPALWVADDRYRALAIRGIFKDFDIDLAVPPQSYCSLTIDGLAESDVAPDPGGDPAVAGMASTLRLIQPVTIDDSVLTASNVPENDAPAWAAGTTYGDAARVIAGHRVFESLTAANVGNDPLTSTGKWVEVGPTNRWAAFDQALGTVMAAAAPIVVTLASGTADALALLDVTGVAVRVQANGYDRTQAVAPGALTFTDLPGGAVTVTIAGPGTVSVGTLLIGRMVALGVTEASPTAGITDYSRKEVDDFGEVTIVQRAWSKRMQARALIRADAVDTVFDRIAALRAIPALWIGDADSDALTIYGFFKDFSIEIGDTTAKLSLTVEGLSRAAKIEPITAPVSWEEVTDPHGTKPADNADVTSDNTSKDTSAVGGRPAADIVRAVEIIEPIAATYPDLTAKVDGIAATYPAIVETVGAIEQAQVGTDAALGALDRVAADHAAALAQAERDAGRIGDTLLRLLAESDRTRAILRDAGVVVDPATGIVRIYAVDQLAERTARAEIVLDAATASITQKASVEYVQQQIALAVLDPVQAAQLEPIIARLTSAEQTISGLGASVSTKAEALELTRVSGRVTTVQSDLDALAGTVSTKASRTDVDAQGVRIGLVEQTLSTLEGVSSFGITVRQARAVAEGAAEAGLRALLAGDDANRRQIVQQAEVRSELIAKLIDQSGVEAAARQVLAVQIGAVDARGVQESVARIAEGKALSQRIDAQSVTNGEQAAAIASLSEASIAAGTGLAGITTTIRQQAANDDTTAEGLLRALIAGDETGRARATQLAQVQSELSTTLIANEQSSAVARQALTVRMAAAEAAIVTTSRALADLTQSLVERITAAEAIIRDPATGLAATRAQLSEVDRLRADGDAANAQSTATLSAQVNDPATGLPATRGEIIRVEQASADRDTAIAGTVVALSAQVNDPATGLPATRAEQVVERQARADGDSANAEAIGTLSAQVNDPATGLPATRGEIIRVAQASADRDAAIAGTVDALSAQVNDAETGLPATRAQQVVDRQARADGDSANARSIDALSAQVNDAATGLPATRVQIGTERDASVERDNALGRRVDTVSASIGDTNAAVAVLGEAMVDGDEANARLIQQVTAKLGDLGEATVQDLIEAVVSETGKILARKVVTVDVNNNLAGWSLIGSEDGPGSFNLINTDLKMGTGRVWFDTGAVMWAMGLGFGKNRDLISWFGPSMPIDQCTRANALEWKGTDLKQYFGGALSAGVIRNAVQTTLTTSGASVSTGPVSSNGRKRTVIVSYSYTYDGEQDGAQAASSGGSSAQVKLYRNGVEIATLNAGGGWQRTAKTNQGPATYSEAIDGSLTIDDNSGGTSPEYRATLIVRSLGPGLSGTPTQDAIAQSISIIQTEELPS